MADKLPLFAGETGTYKTTSPDPHVDLSGTAASFGTYPIQTFAEAAADATQDFASTNTCTVTVWKDGDNWARYEGAVWTDGTPDTLDLSAATLMGAAGTLAGDDAVSVVASLPTISLDLLSDVAIATPAIDQVLKYDGTGWINAAASSISASAGVAFFPDDTTIIAAGAENPYPVKTLAKYPVGGTEDVDSIVLSSNTVPYGEYLYDAAIGSTSVDAGVWTFSFYVGVSSAVNVTSLSTNVMRVRPGTGTVTITGTGTSRTATASSGTPFATDAIDASATNIDASWLRTPKGLYQITARTSDTEVTIATPTGYGNESTVAYSVHKKLFNVSTGEINNVASTYAGMQLIDVNSAQPAFTIEATDKLALFFFGTSDGSRTVYFSHNGTSKYTHVHSPLATRHNDLAYLQGGSAAERYHLTAAQATVVGSITTAAATVLDDATVGDMINTLGGATSTGTGGLARATSPSFVTPILGTPTSGTLTNCTGYPAASTSAAGVAPQATAPDAGLRNVVAIDNGETAYTNKALFDATAPAALGTASPGTEMAAARRDHVHATPKLDDLASPDDNTDLNASTSAHGLLPKLGGGTSNFLRADGTWATPGDSPAPFADEDLAGLSSIVIDVPSGVDQIEVELLDIVPQTDDKYILLTVSDDDESTYEAAGYNTNTQWITTAGGFTRNAALNTSTFYLGSTCGNSTNEYLSERIIFDGLTSGRLFAYTGSGSQLNAGAAFCYVMESGQLLGNTNAITNLKFMMESGNFTSGRLVARLPSATALSAHAVRHQSGGADAIKLDDLAAPDDNTDLNASTTAHGLLVKATAPDSGNLNVVGIANGETGYSNKTVFEGTLKIVVLSDAAYAALSPPVSTTIYITTG